MTTPQVPLFIPSQVCEAVGRDPGTTPPDACLDLVKADLRQDGVSAPASPANAGLAQVVSDAKQQGIDLKIVVLDQNPPIETPLRDIATDVGQAYPGSTVLVLSPSFAGTYSPSFDRVTLEAGQDIAKVSGSPVVASQNFLKELTTPHFPWTPFTIVLVVGVALAAVATRFLQVRAKNRNAAELPARVHD
ncbi:DUF6676 family protein [Mycolicibacterium sp. 050158]|uniref:Rv1476 family membrane protein n=1 Tax=Mycolicibacterium sp. 050158 TaxID=3090602 RepID=UPI00299DA86A|nr:DUF6676 family protein [Mycolicibacterium sp. 050158]MDX1890995.1 DUF6676 family protein [Mycolicibacterium sp. 050158]